MIIFQNFITFVNDLYKKNPDKINKTKDISLYCGKIQGKVAYIKYGKYGYYLNHNNNKISLKSFYGFNIENKIKNSESIQDTELKMIIDFITKENNNPNIVLILSEECSIRKSKYGIYIYYKTSKMKKPKFMKYNDENDEQKEIRNDWIKTSNKVDIINYINEKYKVSI